MKTRGPGHLISLGDLFVFVLLFPFVVKRGGIFRKE